MLKKIFLTLAFVASVALMAKAQQITGQWTIYPQIGFTIDRLVDTPEHAYYLTAGSLYSYDSADNENFVYTTSNRLTDTGISDIYYNYDGRYLLVAYSNGNIDLLYDDGRTVNMPDINDALLTVGRGINSVAFGSDRIYVATQFGLVIFDDTRHEVVESGIWNRNIDEVFLLGDTLMLIEGFTLYGAPCDGRHNSIDKFDVYGGCSGREVTAISDDTYFFKLSTNLTDLYYGKIDREAKTVRLYNLNTRLSGDIQNTPAGIYAAAGDKINIYNPDATLKSTVAIPEAVRGGRASMARGLDAVWFGGAEGVSCYSLAGDTPALVHDTFRPDALTCTTPTDCRWSADGNRLYLNRITYSRIYPSDNNAVQTTNVIENGSCRDVSPAVVPSFDLMTQNAQKANKTTRLLNGNGRMIEDPDDPSIYYFAHYYEGIYVFKDADYYHVFNRNNSPIHCNWGTRMSEVNIDQDGNLWGAYWNDTKDGKAPFVVLPAAKRRGDLTKLTKNDWLLPSGVPANYTGSDDCKSLFCKKSNMNFFTASAWANGILAMNNNGTPSNFTDDKYFWHQAVTDTEGNTISRAYTNKLVEDAAGRVWVATNQGLYVIDNPTDASATSLTVRRPLVPRNDGTNFGDYLLETETIYDIASDPTDRKWIATGSSGVYLVSERGDRIIENFTTANSPLPSNTVYSVACDPHSNRVFFGTSKGVVSYSSDSAPAADDYSEVYAFPNPVRPDYTGWITVTGLMDNSLVKIADISGNVLHQGRSEGGIFTWDGCNAAGERVRSGVYLVLASQNASGNSSGVVTKIMVIN